MRLSQAESTSRTTWGVILLLLLGIGVGAVLHSAETVSGPEVASIWTSVVLTLFLAYIYSQQNDILELQSQIMGGSHTPIVSVSNLKFTHEQPDSGNALQISNNGEFLSFSVKNEGNDLAKGLSMIYIPSFVSNDRARMKSDNDSSISAVIDSIPSVNEDMPFVDESVPPFVAREFPVYSTDYATEASDIEGATVSTGMDETEMFVQAGFYIVEDGQKKPIGIARGIQRLLGDENIDAVILGRVLTYQNPFDESSILVLPPLRFKQETLDASDQNPLNCMIETLDNYYTKPAYREQITHNVEAYLDGKEIIYFEAA